jgi:hypothetical protein
MTPHRLVAILLTVTGALAVTLGAPSAQALPPRTDAAQHAAAPQAHVQPMRLGPTSMHTRRADNIIYLQAKHSGKCMTVYQASLAEGAIVNQYRCLGHHNQWWVAYWLGGTLFRFVGYDSQKCLTVQGNSKSSGAKLVQSTCVNGGNQMFNWWAGSLMKAYHSGLCVAVSGASTADNAAIVQQPCSSGNNQRWNRID